jgi:magnesium-transporting ATPase (P-type)
MIPVLERQVGAGRAVPPPSTATGLTSAEAAQRLDHYGPNEPVQVRRLSALAQFLRLFANPLVAILLVASVISALLGQLDVRTDSSVLPPVDRGRCL